MSATTTTPDHLSTKNERWLSLDTEQLISSVFTAEEKKKLDQFLNLGIPVLQKIKSGFVADVGDIQVCLLIHYVSLPFAAVEEKKSNNSSFDSSGFKVEVCHINEEGELLSRIKEQGDKAVQLLQSFTLDFPEAVWTTSQRKPLCFFTQMKEQKQQVQSQYFQKGMENSDNDGGGENNSLNVLGRFSDYVSYAEFNKIMKSSQKIEKVSVMVPK
jgi:hypothetical protein